MSETASISDTDSVLEIVLISDSPEASNTNQAPDIELKSGRGPTPEMKLLTSTLEGSETSKASETSEASDVSEDSDSEETSGASEESDDENSDTATIPTDLAEIKPNDRRGRHGFEDMEGKYEPIRSLVNFVHMIPDNTRVFMPDKERNPPYGLWCQLGDQPACESPARFEDVDEFVGKVKSMWDAYLEGANGKEEGNGPVFAPELRKTFWIEPIPFKS